MIEFDFGNFHREYDAKKHFLTYCAKSPLPLQSFKTVVFLQKSVGGRFLCQKVDSFFCLISNLYIEFYHLLDVSFAI
jgi:hypothetical protein